jgi:hypothetical protein
MSIANENPTARAHSDRRTAPCRTRGQGTFGRCDVRTGDSLGGRKLVANLTGQVISP